jgi:hypothetical protein
VLAPQDGDVCDSYKMEKMRSAVAPAATRPKFGVPMGAHAPLRLFAPALLAAGAPFCHFAS